MTRFLRRAMGLAAALLPAVSNVEAHAADQAEVQEGGSLSAYGHEGKAIGKCPLKHTDVISEISGFIARVTLTQRFTNPFTEPIEAVYTFPMSERGAVDSMTMTIGDRVIKGNVKEREEAQRIYQQAKNAGKAASLLDQERPNIFTQSVANILPGNDVVITISYVEYLKYEDGQYEFSFPMVVGPRYIPGTPTPVPADAIHSDVDTGAKPGPASTTQVPDASRITPPVTPPGTRAGHDISMEVRIDAGLPIREIKSELHEIDVDTSGSTSVVRLKAKNEIPNRDFIIHYSVTSEKIGDAILTHADDKGGFFTLVLQPPDRVAPEEITPKEMIFVIDSSGSMHGFPLEKAKETMRMCVEGMNPRDTFNLVSFDGGLGYCFDKPVPNTLPNRHKAIEYLAGLTGGGGTEMMPAIHAALGNQNDPERLRVVCFMTDGFIGNDMEILDAIQKNAKTARVFSFGIGSSVNRFLIEGMARAGRGASDVVTLQSDADESAQRFRERIQSPVLTDVSVDFGNLGVHDTYPALDAIPDLFASRPLIITGRYDHAGHGRVTIHGNTSKGPFERMIDVDLPEKEAAHDVLAPLWARQRIAYLMEQDWKGAQARTPDRDIKGAVTALGLEFGLMTQYTSFVAVEERVITEGGKTKTVQVPVEMPDGESYDGVFGKDQNDFSSQLQSLGYVGAPQLAAPTSSFRSSSSSAAGSGSLEVYQLRPNAIFSHGADEGERSAPPSRKAREKAEDVDKSSPKLDPALRGLAGKAVNGSYENGKVKVSKGWVGVFVYVNDLSADTLAQLKKLNIRVITQVQSKKLIHLEVKVDDLEKLAALAVVTKIEPPTF